MDATGVALSSSLGSFSVLVAFLDAGLTDVCFLEEVGTISLSKIFLTALDDVTLLTPVLGANDLADVTFSCLSATVVFLTDFAGVFSELFLLVTVSLDVLFSPSFFVLFEVFSSFSETCFILDVFNF